MVFERHREVYHLQYYLQVCCYSWETTDKVTENQEITSQFLLQFFQTGMITEKDKFVTQTWLLSLWFHIFSFLVCFSSKHSCFYFTIFFVNPHYNWFTGQLNGVTPKKSNMGPWTLDPSLFTHTHTHMHMCGTAGMPCQ